MTSIKLIKYLSLAAMMIAVCALIMDIMIRQNIRAEFWMSTAGMWALTTYLMSWRVEILERNIDRLQNTFDK